MKKIFVALLLLLISCNVKAYSLSEHSISIVNTYYGFEITEKFYANDWEDQIISRDMPKGFVSVFIEENTSPYISDRKLVVRNNKDVVPEVTYKVLYDDNCSKWKGCTLTIPALEETYVERVHISFTASEDITDITFDYDLEAYGDLIHDGNTYILDNNKGINEKEIAIHFKPTSLVSFFLKKEAANFVNGDKYDDHFSNIVLYSHRTILMLLLLITTFVFYLFKLKKRSYKGVIIFHIISWILMAFIIISSNAVYLLYGPLILPFLVIATYIFGDALYNKSLEAGPIIALLMMSAISLFIFYLAGLFTNILLVTNCVALTYTKEVLKNNRKT